MNYFQPYPFQPDEQIVAAWDSQVKEAKETPWLAEALTTQSADLFPRFATCFAELRALPRSARRALQRQLARSREVALPSAWQRKLAHSLAGAALLLALGQGVAQAATIIVNTNKPGILANGKCSLIEAIINANDDLATHPDCAAGSGADTIVLPNNKTHVLTDIYTNFFGDTGLPVITSQITIEGNGAKIIRKKNVPDFRLMAVSVSGNLTLQHVTLSGGRTYGAPGGGVYNRGGTLTIENGTISGNTVAGSPSYYDAHGGGIFNVGGTLTIKNSAISGNSAVGGSASDFSFATGGGIDSFGSDLTIENSAISGNTARSSSASDSSFAEGGGISTHGGKYYGSLLTIENSTISGNIAAAGSAARFSGAIGGGISNTDKYGSLLTIKHSTISGNTAVGGRTRTASYRSFADGGGVSNGYGTLTIENSTISKNTALGGSGSPSSFSHGGGASNRYGTVTIENSTISGNTARSRSASYSSRAFGGGVSNDYALLIKNSTISGNTVESGSASHDSIADGGGVSNSGYSTIVTRSLISGNKATAGPEIDNSYYGAVTADNFNLFGTNGNAGVTGFTPGASDIVPAPGVTLKKILGPLKKNGGSTKTHALVRGSPAIDAAPVDADCPATDQRGVTRPRGPGCDIGAFEK